MQFLNAFRFVAGFWLHPGGLFKRADLVVYDDPALRFAMINRRTCPRCGPGPSGGVPIERGDPWICTDCATVGRIEADGILRVPTEGEEVALMLSPAWDQMWLVEQAVIRRIEATDASRREI